MSKEQDAQFPFNHGPPLLHCENEIEIHRMAGAELRLLVVLCTQDLPDTVKQLKVTLARVGGQSKTKEKSL